MIPRGAAGSTREGDRLLLGGADRRGRHFGGGTDGRDSTGSRRDGDVARIFPPPCSRCGQGLRAVVASACRTRPPIRPALARVLGALGVVRSRTQRGVAFGWGSKWGSPGEHRAMRFGHEPSVATDFRAEEGLVVASALPSNDRGAGPRGDAGAASRKGKALEGRHRWESAEAVAGMRPRCAATR
jgi:hypothetical protein